MKIGQLVMLVGTDDFMPPLGSIGEIIEPFDGEDYGVMFPNCPCPVPPGIQWYIPPNFLMRIDPIQDCDIGQIETIEPNIFTEMAIL